MTWDSIDLRRAAAGFIVVLLHVTVIAVLLRVTMIHPNAAASSAREFVLQFFKPEAPAKPEPPASAPPVRLIAPAAPNPITLPPAQPNGSTVQGLHRSLFDCAPENIANLPPEERADCTSQVMAPPTDETNTLRNLPSRSKDPRHWARALARKQNPALLPCMPPFNPLYTAKCLGAAAANGGFGDLDAAPGYGDVNSGQYEMRKPYDPKAPYAPLERLPQ